MSGGCGKRVLTCLAAMLAVVTAFGVGVTALYLFGLNREQQQSDAWYLAQIESRFGYDFGDGEWGTFEQRVYRTGRDYNLEAVVRLHEQAGDLSPSGWLQTPCSGELLANLEYVTGVMDDALAAPMRRAVCEEGNRYRAVIRREGDWLDRFDLCVLDESENLLYVIALHF